ncbi:hypothetical protein DFH06DRAFT_766635 [Mycena polygramma]|nr:hypothetical protein DFH06DRAFT_766635 [Mycena polygramma]
MHCILRILTLRPRLLARAASHPPLEKQKQKHKKHQHQHTPAGGAAVSFSCPLLPCPSPLFSIISISFFARNGTAARRGYITGLQVTGRTCGYDSTRIWIYVVSFLLILFLSLLLLDFVSLRLWLSLSLHLSTVYYLPHPTPRTPPCLFCLPTHARRTLHAASSLHSHHHASIHPPTLQHRYRYSRYDTSRYDTILG